MRRIPGRRQTLALAVAALALLLPAVLLAAGPKLHGPVTGGERGAPFAAPAVDVAARGYVVEELFLTGAASAYRLADGASHGEDGRWRTERESETVPFRTRILVVRPDAQERFNGTVVVHWQNVTAGYELGTVGGDSEYLRGYAWVGVSAQKIGVDGFPGPEAAGLRQWDPERYGSLEHPGDAWSYDIFTQAARMVAPDRPRGRVDAMGGLEVERLVAAGASQSASRLRTYINGVQPLEGVFDGFIPYIDFASPVPFAADRGGPRTRTPTRIREDLEVPVFVVNSETETLAYFPARQPDNDRYRFWEVAGTSHVSVSRDAAATTPGLDAPNWMSYTPAYDAAVRHMHAWLTRGEAPPKMPPIEVSTAGGSPEIARDELGNARGGIRLPDLAVPTAVHGGIGKRTEGGNRFAFLYGHARDLSAEELARLYDSRADFLARYDAALAASVAAGVVLEDDVPRLRAAAVAWAEQGLPAS